MSQSANSFDIQGHRGARGLMPENTILGFKKAIDEGVTTLELDVIVSKDKKIVVSHEPQFNPIITTKPDGGFFKTMQESNLYNMTYAEIKKYDVGLKGHTGFPDQTKVAAYKPLLKDLLNEVEVYLKKKNNIKYNIEIKSLANEYDITQPQVKEFCDLVLKTIGKKINAENLTIQSFDFNVLKYLHQINSNSKNKKFNISALIEPDDNNEIELNIEKLGFIPDIWSPFYKLLSTEKIELLHAKGIKVIPWTVNTLEDMKKMVQIGCDGLITDYPDRAKNIF
jgi:glycerophosphoryl diester phosphodiesterase